ncbi:MAG: SCP2 sterol-binding domain-containing protein [Williamsia sp.]|nr:SCP2 sterol-binding domain-containing protein [Williamsia sp.]
MENAIKYDQSFWDKVLDNLNKGQYVKEFANLGTIAFEVIDEPSCKTFIKWDSDGFAKIIGATDNLIATFSATVVNWDKFIDGKFNAAQGVLLGKIKFSGSLRKIIKYVGAFNHLAKCGKIATKN